MKSHSIKMRLYSRVFVVIVFISFVRPSVGQVGMSVGSQMVGAPPTMAARSDSLDRWQEEMIFRYLRQSTKGGTSTIDGRPTVSVTDLQIPQKARKLLEKAFQAKDAAEKGRLVDKAVEICPQYAEALSLRAFLEMQASPEKALADATQAIQYDRNLGAGYLALGTTYNTIARFEEAIRPLDRAITLLPTEWEAYFEMSIAQAGKQDYSAALVHFAKAQSFCPKSYSFFHYLKAYILLGLKSDDAARTEFEAYLRNEPNGAFSIAARENLNTLQGAQRRK